MTAVMKSDDLVERYYVTVLSNLMRGLDKYSQTYSKVRIRESTYSDRFFLLRHSDLFIGFEKAGKLLADLALPGNRLLVLKALVPSQELHPNVRTGLGEFVEGAVIRVEEVYYVDDEGSLEPVFLEEACARSLAVLYGMNRDYECIRPRSVSVLPIAIGCQAACQFCFSKASASADQERGHLKEERIQGVLKEAKARGAERAVITGGGEPGMLSQVKLEHLIKICAHFFEKVVLITNGYALGKLEAEECLESLLGLQQAGLSVLAMSRHFHSKAGNEVIMKLDTRSDKVARVWQQNQAALSGLHLRWICVLQKGGVDSDETLKAYLDWVIDTGVEEVCFKELYVSTSEESEYHDYPSNRWSRAKQVSLSLVTEFAKREEWELEYCLPWGAPVYRLERGGRSLRVAAYTEPSLYWELSHGECRSWNLMTDGRCLASLEDRDSEVVNGL